MDANICPSNGGTRHIFSLIVLGLKKNTVLMKEILSQPLKWELKQKPGMSPPRGGYNPDDPNQQIVAEDIFDEYGGMTCKHG